MATRRSAPSLRPAELLEELDRGLASKTPPRVVIAATAPAARGEEPFLSDLAIRRIVARAETSGAEVATFDAGASGFDPSGLFAELTTRSLFAASTLRVVRGADALLKGGRGAASEDAEGDEESPKRSREAAVSPFERAVLAFAAGAAAGDGLAIVARKLRAPFARAVREAGGLVLEFRPLYDKPFRGDGPVESTELGAFVQSLAKEASLRLGRGALAALLARTGSSLGAAAAALEKLRSVHASAEVSVRDVELHVAATRAGSAWTLAEAIVQGEPGRALSEIALLAESGARDSDGKSIAADGAFAMALSAVVRDARRNAAAAARMAEGSTFEEAASAAGVPSFPAALDSFRKALGARRPPEHARFLDDVAEAELSIRRGGEKAQSALERLAFRGRRGGARR